jgi:hypothetical protein
LFSTTIDLAQRGFQLLRQQPGQYTSGELPAVDGTINLIARCGQDCANAPAQASNRAPATTQAR